MKNGLLLNLCSGMSLVIYIFKLLLYKLGIYMGGRNVCVTKHFLDCVDICTVFKQMCGKGMTERMRRYINYNSVNKIYQKCQRYVMILELIETRRKKRGRDTV